MVKNLVIKRGAKLSHKPAVNCRILGGFCYSIFFPAHLLLQIQIALQTKDFWKKVIYMFMLFSDSCEPSAQFTKYFLTSLMIIIR